MKRHQGFAPVAGEEPKVLILGTFPGLASRQEEQYYAHPRNQFWPILFQICGQEFNGQPYAERLELLRTNGVALWDIVESCETEGSADTDIQNRRLIDLPGFLDRYPTIELVCFNGGNGARFAKQLGQLAVPIAVLPSTSPANARYGFAHKLEAWGNVLRPILQRGERNHENH